MKINDKLIELYKNNKKDEVIKYCNNLYKKSSLYLEELQSNEYYWEECAKHLCNFAILGALRNKKTETSNVIVIARNVLVEALINDEILNKNKTKDKLEIEELEKAFNSVRQNHSVNMGIISEGIKLLWCLYKMDSNSMKKEVFLNYDVII